MDTSFLSEINWIAVFCATLAYFGFGRFLVFQITFCQCLAETYRY